MTLTDADVKKYKAIVELHVKRYAARTPSHITIEDIRGAAHVGLLEAAAKFDESLGWKFNTYASRRIKGAIRDYLRALDWVPRLTRKRTNELERAFHAATQAAQAAPSDEQIADAADMSLEDYYDTVAVTGHREVFSFEGQDRNDRANSDLVGDRGAVNPEREAGNTLFLRRALKRLNPSERAVIEGCDLGGATLKKVAEGLGIGESRACQLRKAAYSKMRAAA
jgi:RNA polymerase sigma factor for flagellar operon FliA